jgi:hypothetical protein
MLDQLMIINSAGPLILASLIAVFKNTFLDVTKKYELGDF